MNLVEGLTAELRWYAVWTRSRQEKVSAAMLDDLGVENFLPLKAELRQWSDRKQMVRFPLFSGYLFVRLNLRKHSKLEVLKVPGIGGFVGNQAGSLPIPDKQIDAVRTVLRLGVDCSVDVPLEQGDRVRVIRGALAGVEGTLARTDSNSRPRLLISIDMIRQSLSVNVSREDVEVVTFETGGSSAVSDAPEALIHLLS